MCSGVLPRTKSKFRFEGDGYRNSQIDYSGARRAQHVPTLDRHFQVSLRRAPRRLNKGFASTMNEVHFKASQIWHLPAGRHPCSGLQLHSCCGEW